MVKRSEIKQTLLYLPNFSQEKGERDSNDVTINVDENFNLMAAYKK